jgi:hypothetical protein
MCEIAMNAKERSVHPLPVQIAYLGGQYAHERQMPAVEARIKSHLADSFPSEDFGPLPSGDLLDRGRFVGQEELMVASQSLRHLPMGGEVILDVGSQARFQQASRNILNSLKDGETKAALMHSKSHWLPAVFHKSEDGGLHCWVVDSNASAPSGKNLEKDLKSLLSFSGSQPPLKVEAHIVRDEMQMNVPNSCGLLGMRLFEALDGRIENNKGKVAARDIEQTINNHVNSWRKLDEEQQNAFVTMKRADVLASWIEANKSN